MRVLVISHEFPPQVGGAGIVAQQVIDVLNEYRHEVHLVTRRINKPKSNCTYKTYNILPSINIPGIWLFTSFLRLLFFNFSRYDRIVLNDFPSSVVASFLFKKSTLARSIFFWHGSEDKNILLKESVNGKLFRKPYINALKRSVRILAVSEFQKEKILRDADLVGIREKVQVQYAGVNDDLFYPYGEEKRNDLRNRFKFSGEDIVLLSVGRINKLKGYDEMFEIFKKLPDNYKWVIIGNGELLEWLRGESDKNNLSNIFLIGEIERQLINDYYNIADLFYLFSSIQWHEAFGLVYIEAALSGLPCIARKKEKDGTNEAVKDVGWLLPDEETVLKFIQSNSYLNSNRILIRKHALKYSLNSQKSGIINNITN